MTHIRSFNGAATCSLRNAPINPCRRVHTAILQWGRNLFVAECGFRPAARPIPMRPSMGPQLVRCGMECTHDHSRLRPPPSMGPQLVRCGMQHHGHGCSLYRTCLQWGRNLFVAECKPASHVVKPSFLLQWGRNLFVAECSADNGKVQPRCRPSMGPQLVRCGMLDIRLTWVMSAFLQWGRNLFVAECVAAPEGALEPCAPSMGPQLVRCGMSIMLLFASVKMIILQWGRNLFVAECALAKPTLTIWRDLQWGRNLFVAECFYLRRRAFPHLKPSMGPQLVRCGMTKQTPKLQTKQTPPSMGPQLVRCGMASRTARTARTASSFNGAATCSLRNERTRTRCGRSSKPSMGPQLVRCGMRRMSTHGFGPGDLQWGRNLFVAE